VLNPAFSTGTKDYDASRLILEPLFDFDVNNNIVPVLAAEVPSLANGGVAQDGSSVTIKLRQGVTWSDGQPFTADDVVFNWQYNSNTTIASSWLSNFQHVKSCEAVDQYTVKYTWLKPYAGWWTPGTAWTLPKHIFGSDLQNPKNAKSNPYNLKPIGTGPYKIVSFKPGDVGVYTINENYWDPGKPHYDGINMKGGGDATSAARAVLETGEVDWAWNLQVAPNILAAMGTKLGKIATSPGGGCERLEINFSDPNTTTDGQKSYYKTPHPHFKVLAVRQALNYLIDRKTIATTLYGPGGSATGSPYNTNPDNMPPGIQDYEYSVDKANTLLDQAGAKKGSDGIRVLNGRKMSWLYATSVNTVRQQQQEIMKASCSQAGIELTLKSTDASVFFGDPSNPDALSTFYCDLEMFTNTGSFYPDQWYLRYYSGDPSVDIDQQSNGWNGYNFLRYQNPAFNAAYDKVVAEIDPTQFHAGFAGLLKMVVDDVADCGTVNRNGVNAVANTVDGYQNLGAFSSSTVWDIKDWYKKKA